MKLKTTVFAVCLGLLMICLGAMATAKTGNGKDNDKAAAATTASHPAQDDSSRLEGEKRFHSNCGRCHTAPPRFSTRMTATIIRHMRVRATITEEDMHLILHYMTQ